jgi:hypothetical protein
MTNPDQNAWVHSFTGINPTATGGTAKGGGGAASPGSSAAVSNTADGAAATNLQDNSGGNAPTGAAAGAQTGNGQAKFGGTAKNPGHTTSAAGQNRPRTAPLQRQHRLSNPRPIQTRPPAAAYGNPPAAGAGDAPHLGVDASLTWPWSGQFTLVARNVNLHTWGDPHRLALDLFHEPNISLTLDPASGLSFQEMVALLDLHWVPPWRREIEVSLSAFLNEAVPTGAMSGGGQLQVEQHIVDWFSITVSMSGTANSSGFLMSGNAGVLFHIR